MTALINLAMWLLGLFGFGKPDPMKAGIEAGAAEKEAATDRKVLTDVLSAQDAARTVDADIASGRVPIEQSDGFRRD